MLPDGSIVPITDEILDMSECFAKQNNLFNSYAVITKLNRSILNGMLDYSAETQAYKETLKNKIITTHTECKTLSEYISMQNSSQPKED